MRKLVLLLMLTLAATAQAAPVRDPELEKFLRRAMTACPGGQLVIEPVSEAGPAGFNPYRVTQTSKIDDRCKEVEFAMVSKSTSQVLIAMVYVLQDDGRKLETRITETVARATEKTPKISLDGMPLADGLTRVIIRVETPNGPLITTAYLDSSKRFLMAGRLLDRRQDPGKAFLKAVDAENGARRGNKSAPVEILEISDLQCPTCQKAHSQVEPFLKKFGDRVSYIRLDLPFFEHHEWAFQAAMAARAIQRVAPQAYWAYVDFIFSNQDKITAPTLETRIKEFCADHDVDWAKIKPIYSSPSERGALVAQVGRFYDNEIYATPTFIVNGQKMFYAPDKDTMWQYVQSLLGPVATK